jgi:hypothetical protein
MFRHRFTCRQRICTVHVGAPASTYIYTCIIYARGSISYTRRHREHFPRRPHCPGPPPSLRRGVRLRWCAHPPRALPALAVAAPTVALGHHSGAYLLVAAALDGASPAAWVGHLFAWGASGAPRALGGVDGTLFSSDVGATTVIATTSFGPPPRSEGASQAVPHFTSWSSLRMTASTIR